MTLSMKNVFACLLASVSIFFGAAPANSAEVVGNNEVAAYIGTGGLLLPGSFSGSPETKSSVANCPECVWAYTVFCMYDADGLCKHAVESCPAGQVKYRVWFGQTKGTLSVVGSVCWGTGTPLTRRALESYLSDYVISYVPALKINLAPPDGSITSVPVVAWVEQPAVFNPPAFQLGGRTVWLNATAAWRWIWGDGAIEWKVIPGLAYPNKQITHQYRQPGQYTLSVSTHWQATYTVEGVGKFAAGGDLVTQTANQTLTILQTRGVLMK